MGNRAALVVAADDFIDPRFQRLRSPSADVDALAAALDDAAIGGFEVRTVLNQSSALVQQELERFFSGREPDDLLLLYFSCHGIKDLTGRLYLVMPDTAFDLLRSTGVSATFISEQIEYSRAKRVIVLLDCCYSGAFLRGFRFRGDDTVDVEQFGGRGRAVITASRATEYAFEAEGKAEAEAEAEPVRLAADDARPSVFTGAIVEGLASGSADANGDGLVTIDELYDYVYDVVRAQVAGQTPGRWMEVEGNLVVARNPSLRVPASPGVDEIPMTAPSLPLAPIGAPPAPVPTLPEPLDRRTRGAGWLAAAGGAAILVSPYPTYLEEEYPDSLLNRYELSGLAVTLLFGLAASASYCLLRTAGHRDDGVDLLRGLLPAGLGVAVLAMAHYEYAEAAGPDVGWLLLQAGLVLVTAAGVLTLIGDRGERASRADLSRRGRRRGLAVTTAAPIVLAATCAFGWGRLFILDGDGLLGVDGPLADYIVQSALLAGVGMVVWPRLERRGIPTGVLASVTAVAFGGITWSLLAAESTRGSGEWFAFAAAAVLATGALAVLAGSTRVQPDRGSRTLAAWAAGAAATVPLSPAYSPDPLLLLVGLIGVGLLAAVLASSTERGRSSVTAAAAHEPDL